MEQKMLDEIYEEIVVVLNRGLVEKSERRGRKRQPWFTKEIAALRREFHKAEGVWLRSRNADDRKVRGRSMWRRGGLSTSPSQLHSIDTLTHSGHFKIAHQP